MVLPYDIQSLLKYEQEILEYVIPYVYPFDLEQQQYLLSYHLWQGYSYFKLLVSFSVKEPMLLTTPFQQSNVLLQLLYLFCLL
jgi:hypothetical protein